MAVWVCQPNGITRQYYSDDAWGTNVWLNGTSASDHYHNQYYSGGTQFTDIAQFKNGDWEVVTVMIMGSDAQLRQVVSYSNGDYYFKRHWELTNTSGGTLSDVRFFHGGDTYFGGSDSARSWWNATQNMIYVNNSSFANSGVMGFYGSPATPADHYFGGQYSTGRTQASSTARLDDTANSNYVDAGYQLEWDRATLEDGDTWVIEAYELWTDPTFVQVLPPADQLTLDDTTIDVEFTLHNLDTSSHTFDLSASSELGWTTTLPGGSSSTLSGLVEQQVTVQVVVPAGLAAGTSSSITLTATDTGGGGDGSASTTVEVFDPDYTISPLAVDFGSVATSGSETSLVVVTNSGSDVTFGTVANTNGLAAPFSITDDGISGVTLSTGESCTLELTFSPSSTGSASDDFDIPVFSPVVTSHLVTVTGEGVDLEPEINVTGNSVTIPDGSTIPSSTDHTAYGQVDVAASTLTITYTIQNLGDGTLTLTDSSPYVTLTGHTTDFSVTAVPDASIAPGDSTTFEITFDPTAIGVRTATVAIANDDTDENPYNFAIEGTGMTPLAIMTQMPPANALDWDAVTQIMVYFNQNIDGPTANDTSFLVRGSLSGPTSGTVLPDGGNGISFMPSSAFLVGETVTVTLTTDIAGSVGGGTLPAPLSWQFTIGPTDGHAYFEDSGQSLASLASRWTSLGDLDGDGDLDMLVAVSSAGNRVYLNAGGVLTDTGQLLGSGSSWSANLGDLDGDGDLDAYIANYSSEANRVWLNDGTGAFLDSGQALGSGSSIEAELGDLDGDGDLDAFVANYSSGPDRIWLNDGTGTFSDSGQALGAGSSFSVELGDVDGDGDLDALVADGYTDNLLWLNDGTGVFTDSGQPVGAGRTLGVALGDLDGDGDLDAFTANFNNEPNEVWLNTGTGVFVDSGQELGTAVSRCVALGDLDADGDLDAFVANEYEANTIWLNDGLSAFTSSGQSLGSSTSHMAKLGDLDGDGDLDAVVANANQPNAVWLNVEPIEIDVAGNGQSIVDGDTTPSLDDHSDFGEAELVVGSVTRTFTVRNTGSGELRLTGTPLVEVLGAAAADFTLTASPDSVIAGGDSTSFEVTFDPMDVGARTATLSIANDDSDENPYDFAVAGFCVAAPVITSPATANAIEDIAFVYQATADDPDGPSLSFTFDHLPVWLTAGADSVYGIPDEGSSDTSFTVVASDGSLADTLEVEVTVTPVNDAPVITSPAIAEATEDQFFSYRATAYDPDTGGAPLALEITYAFDQMPSWLSAATDSVYGTPQEGDEDTSFRIIASDGSLSDTLVVAVTVNTVNDAPVITSPAFATAIEDVHFSYAATATDIDGPAATFAFEGLPDWLEPHPSGSAVHGTPGEGTPDATFRVVATDGALSDTLAVQVTVVGTNDGPTITSPSDVVAIEEQSFEYQCEAVDPDDTELVFYVDRMPEWMSADEGTVTGVPPEGAMSVTFRVTVSDGSLRDTMDVRVSIEPVNDPPVITSADAAYVTEDLYFSYRATVTDPDGPVLYLGFEDLPDWLVASADFVYGTPREGATGTSFRVIANDGIASDTLTVSLLMIAVNDAPEISSPASAVATEDERFSYRATATDPDMRGLTFSFEDLPVWLTAVGDSVYGCPVEGDGDTSFRVVVTDGSLSDELMVDVTVKAVNDPPVITSTTLVVATEDEYFRYAASAIDPDGPITNYIFEGLPDWLTAGIGTVYGTPLEGDGNTSFRVIATDGSLSDTLSVSVRVNPQNDAPMITSSDTAEAAAFEYFNYVASAVDLDGPVLRFTFDGLPGWLSADADSVYGTPGSSAVDASFTVVASDGDLSDTLVVALRVTQTLDAPALHLAGPNPFRSSTTIHYQLPSDTDVRMTIYDVRGREIVTLVDGRRPAGYHEVVWDATDARGRDVATGVYFIRITTPDYGKSVKTMVLR